ncbi:MAG TPA: proton-conducting transporter membrane subunit [Anaerolineae bacterium]|jgi:proton-translocating NADH-quinone oxidoreductase chain N
MNNAFLWLIALPLLAAPVIYILGRIPFSRMAYHTVTLDAREARLVLANPQTRLPAYLSLAVMLAMWVAFAAAVLQFQANGTQTFTLGSVSLRLDGLSLLLGAVSLGLGTLVVIFSGPYMANDTGEEKYYALLVLMVGVMIGLGCAYDLFNLWVWFEAMAVSSYLLVAFYHEQPASLESGVKYLIQSAAGSVLVLLGIALVYAQTGALALDQIQVAARASGNAPVLLAAGALFLIGYGVKAALVPLHTWLPDAHSQAPSGISAMLSGVVIEAGLVALLRSLGAIGVAAVSWSTLFFIFGALNMLLGNLLALRQTQVKRLLAFSSLSHVGYMLLGIGIAVYSGQPGGAEGSFFHLFNHALMKGLAFLAAGALLYCLYISAGSHDSLLISDLAGAARRYPLPALALSIAVLALGGLPPLAGFMSKWQIFVAGFQTRDAVVMGLVIFAALNSVLSLGYYAPLVSAMYRQEPSAAVRRGAPLPVMMGIPLVVLSLAVIAIGFWPSLVQWLSAPAGAALLTAFGR